MILFQCIRAILLIGAIFFFFILRKKRKINRFSFGLLSLVTIAILGSLNYYEGKSQDVSKQIYLVQSYTMDEESKTVSLSYYDDQMELVTEEYKQGEYSWGEVNGAGEIVIQDEVYEQGIAFFNTFKLKLNKTIRSSERQVILAEPLTEETSTEE